MQSLTALLHTSNDELRLGRCLEGLYPCDEVLIVDHGSIDGTLHVAREYGARVIAAVPGNSPDSYRRLARASWIFCLDSRESLTEGLAASLYEWKSQTPPAHATGAQAFSVFLREETDAGWIEHRMAQTRLVPVAWDRWQDALPAHDASAVTLEGELLRFAMP